MKPLVVTRHQSLVDYMKEINLIPEDCDVIAEPSIELVRGRDVVGILPLFMAVEANSITTLPMNVTLEQRGRELSLEEMRQVAGKPVTYKVTKVSS